MHQVGNKTSLNTKETTCCVQVTACMVFKVIKTGADGTVGCFWDFPDLSEVMESGCLVVKVTGIGI